MKTLLQLLSVGVGVAIAFSQSGMSQAQSTHRSVPEDPEPPLPTATLPAAKPLIPKSAELSSTSGLAVPVFFDPAKLTSTSIVETTSVLSRIQKAAPAPVVSPFKTQQISQTTPLPPSTPPATTPRPPARPTPAPSPTPTPPVSPPATSIPAPPPTTTPNCPPVDPANLRRVNPQAADLLSKPLQFPTNPCEVRVLGAQPLTLQEVLGLAERGSRDVEIARLQLEQAQAALREARAGNLPTLGLQADLTRSGDAFISGEDRSNLPGQQQSSGGFTRTTLSTALNLTYDLYTSGLRGANIRAAERQTRAGELLLEQTLEQLRLDTSTDYYNLQNADQQVIINQAAVTNAEANLRDSQAQERAGLGTRLDVLRAEVNLANARQQLINALSDQAVRQRQLSQRLGLPYARITAADPVQPAGTWTLPLEDSIVLAFKNRAELETQLVQRDISDAQIRAARAENGPRLSLSAGYQFQRSVLSDFPETPISDGSQSSDGYSIALQARMNLFDGGATNARIRQRQKDREIAEARFAQNRDQIRFQVEQAYSTLQAQQANIVTTEQAVAQAEEALRLAVLRFQAGVGTQTERINAEAELTRARGNRLSAIISYNLALAQLRRAISNISYR